MDGNCQTACTGKKTGVASILDEPLDQDFNSTFAALVEAFRMRKPDARERANQLLVRYASDARYATDGCRALHRARAEAIADLMNKNRNATLRFDDTGPTPETSARPSRIDPIKSLVESNHLNAEHERTARRIQRVQEALTRAVHVKTSKLERSSGGTGNMPTLIAVELAQVYGPWRIRLTRKPDVLRLVELVLIDGLSLDAARRRCRFGWPRSAIELRDALNLYEYFDDLAKRTEPPAGADGPV